MTLTAEQTLARSMSENELLERVMDLLGLYNYRAFHVRNSKAGVIQGQVGFPDIVAIRANTKGPILAIELKAERGMVAPEQQGWLEAFRDAGAFVYVWRPSHYLSGRIGAVLGLHGPVTP